MQKIRDAGLSGSCGLVGNCEQPGEDAELRWAGTFSSPTAPCGCWAIASKYRLSYVKNMSYIIMRKYFVIYL
jgi:hypothetical protein